MASEIPWELREEAEELYIIEGLTYDDAAKKTGISVQTLKKWGAAEGWADRRREYRGTRRQIEEKTNKLRIKLIDDALGGTVDAQAVYAFARVERLVLEKQKKKAAAVADDVEKIAKKSGLSDEAAEQIKEKILGIPKNV